MLRAQRISLRYDPRILLRKHLAFLELSLTRPTVHIVEGPDGWNVATLARPSDAQSTTDIEFQKLAIVDGDLTVDPASMDARHFEHLNAGLELSYSSGRLRLNIGGLSLQDVETGLEMHGTADLQSDAGRVNARMDVESNAGSLAGTVSGQHKDKNREVHARLSVKQLNLAPILARRDLASDITGDVRVAALMPPMASASSRISFEVDAPAVTAAGYSARDVKGRGSYAASVLHLDVAGSAYGAAATAKGEWRSASAAHAPNTLALAGRFKGLDIRRVPASFQAPVLDSRLGGRYDFSYRPGRWEVALVLDRSEIEGASVGSGTSVRASMRGGVPEYELRGRVAGLNLQRFAQPLHVAVLNQDRFTSRITGDVHVRGRGRTLDTTALDAEATLTDSTIGPAHLPAASLTAALDRRRLAIDFSGPFEHVNNDLLGVSGAPIDLTGATDGLRVVFEDLRAPVTVESVEADGRVTLQRSVIAGYDVDRVDIDATLAGGVATIRDLSADGSELRAAAQGTLALTGDAASDLKFTVDTDSLQTAGKPLGQPIAGAGHVEGTVTGPPERLTAAGDLALREVAYGTSFSALTLNGTFGLDVTDQQWRDVTAHANTTATFVTLAGQDVQRMTTDATYRAGSLDVDTQIEQKERTLDVAGGMLFEPEQDEIRLRRLALTTANQVWSLPDGREAVIQYGGGRVVIQDFVVARGPQRLGVAGILGLGNPGGVQASGVDVTAENLQLADLRELLSGTYKVSGVLNGTAHVQGTTAAPVIESTLTVTEGSIEATTFQSLTGNFGYRDQRLTLNARLDAKPGAELTAEGSLPLAFGKAPGAPGDQPVDLRVQSTPIDLGFFQSLTTHLTTITGTGQFNVHVTGTPRAPRLNGNMDLANAGFQVPPLGTSYTRGNARVRFEGERVLIDHFVIEDDDRHTLTIEGGAEVASGRAVRAVDLHVVSDEMHLLRNEFGEVELDADLKASGALGALQITGQARVQRGRLEVDRILGQFNTTAYSTESQHAAAHGEEAVAPHDHEGEADHRETPADQVAQAVSGTPYDNATINVSLVMPDDVVLRARNLRPSPESMGLGSTNLTVGGTLTLEKAPRGKLTLAGGIAAVRGFYDFQGRRFDIVRGSEVQFRGNQPIDPGLNVSASREISGVRTEVGVRGTARQPELHLSSYPPLDQSDILSLIVFGQPVNTLGESQRVNLAQRAGNLALGSVAGPLAESVGRALNLDLFEIRAEGEGGAPELALGSQLGTRVYIGLRQEFGREDVSVVTFEYRFSELLRLVTSVAQGVPQTHATRRNDPTGMDLMFVIRY